MLNKILKTEVFIVRLCFIIIASIDPPPPQSFDYILFIHLHPIHLELKLQIIYFLLPDYHPNDIFRGRIVFRFVRSYKNGMSLESDSVQLTTNVTSNSSSVLDGSEAEEKQGNAVLVAWVFLFVAIFIETCGTACLKLSNGYKNLVPSVLFFCCYALSLGILPLALKQIPMSICYAVWAGTGTALTTIVSVVFFKDNISWGKGLSIVGIIISLALLNYFEGQIENDSSKN